MSKKRKKNKDLAAPREPKELKPLGVFRKNLDYGEGPFFGIPQSIPEYRKKRERRLKRKKALISILGIEKFAGIIEPPPVTYRKIVDWVQMVYSEHILWMMQQAGVENKILEQKCIDAGAREPNNIGLIPPFKKFEIDTTNWKYSNIFKWDPDKHEEIIVAITKTRNPNLGLWYKNKYLLVVNAQIPPLRELVKKPYIFERIMWEIKNIVGHELVHAVQTYISEYKGLEEEFGLPSRSIRSKRDPHGFKINPKTKGVTRHPRITHSLRDVEFYALLYQEIYDLKKYINLMKHLVSVKKLIKVFIGIDKKEGIFPASPFFKELKKRSPEKWRKAAKELISEMIKSGYFEEEQKKVASANT